MSDSLIQPIHSNSWFIQKRVNWLSLWMGHWIIDSLDSFKHVDSFSNETQLCCSETHNSSAVALIETIFVSEIEQKQSIFCLKYNSLNFCLLFEIPLYKISVSLQSCWYCFFWGNIMAVCDALIIFCKSFFSTAVCTYTFLRVTLCVLSRSHTHSGCASLIWHDINTLSVAVYTECHFKIRIILLRNDVFTRDCDIYCECARGCDVSACAAGNKRFGLELCKTWDWPAGHRSGLFMRKISRFRYCPVNRCISIIL